MTFLTPLLFAAETVKSYIGHQTIVVQGGDARVNQVEIF